LTANSAHLVSDIDSVSYLRRLTVDLGGLESPCGDFGFEKQIELSVRSAPSESSACLLGVLEVVTHLVSGNLKITYIVLSVADPAQNKPEYFGPQFQSMGESIRGTMIPQMMFMSW
jgi:hypothetical protein